MSDERRFDLPFPGRVNPERVAARARNLAWARGQHLLVGAEAERRYLFGEVAELSAFAYPDAIGADIDLAFDVMGWFFLFDDPFDVPEGSYPHAALAACQALINLVHQPEHPVAPGAPPVVTAFADCWRRMAEGMTRDWVERAAHMWVDYLEGYYTEAADRLHPGGVDSRTHHRVRRKTVGMRPSLALGERLVRAQVPTVAWHCTHLEAMRVITLDNVIYINEVFSFEKDKARGDTNLVRLLMCEHGCGLTEAIDLVRSWVHADAQTFLKAEGGLPQLCDALGLDQPGRDAVRHHVACMRNWMGGALAWHHSSGRYSPETAQTIATEQVGILNTGDLTTWDHQPPNETRPSATA